MVESSSHLKRKVPVGARVSPPPVRRKVQSTTTQNAVASFFTRTSLKPPEKITWRERAPNDNTPASLLVGKYGFLGERTDSQKNPSKVKIAAFDFDSTLVETASGKKFASGAHDWKWWHASVPGVVKKLQSEDGYRIVIISNQAGIALKENLKALKAVNARLSAFKAKVAAVVTQLDIPISIYAATEKDVYRKPRTGMWNEMLDDFDLTPADIDLKSSMFVGDAGGRIAGPGIAKDFSCTDRGFAENVGITFYTPEEYFLKEAPREFRRSFEPGRYLSKPAGASPDKGAPSGLSEQKTPSFIKINDQEVVIFVGSPGAGKSSFFWKYLEPLGYMRVNQDILKTRDKCIQRAEEFLLDDKSVVVDNTNPDVDVRSKWIALAAKHKIPIRCVLFLGDPGLFEHNDAVRALNQVMNPERRTILPKMAFSGFASRYRAPQLEEGFQDITEVKFEFAGSDHEREIWTRHWI